MGRRKKIHDEPPLFLTVVFSVDYRGPDDNVLTFVFMGALWEQVTKTFVFLVGGANGIAKSFEQYEEHACIHRNGKGYRRIAVEIKEPNYHFASLNDMCLLIEARLKAENPCKVTFMKDYQQFINI